MELEIFSQAFVFYMIGCECASEGVRECVCERVRKNNIVAVMIYDVDDTRL